LLTVDLSTAKERQEGCLAGTYKGRMDVQVFITTDWYNNQPFFICEGKSKAIPVTGREGP
jgi:hypothetical protein